MADDDYSVQKAESGASTTRPIQCSALRKGGHVVIKEHPCKIVDMSTSKTGKHGHAKVHLVAIDIFTGKKYEDICPSTHNMSVPDVIRTEYTVVDIESDGSLSLMAEDGNIKEDMNLPISDVGEELKRRHAADESMMVTVIKAMGNELIISCKLSNS